MWPSHDMYKRICSLFSVGNDAQKGDISRRLDTLTLRENATSQEMQAHFDAFFALLSEGKSIGLDVADWDRREKFLLSLPRDLQTTLRTSLRGRSTQTWAELCSLFNEVIDIRSRQDLRDAQINAAVKTPKIGGRETGGKGKNKGKGKKRKNKKENSSAGGIKCNWCGLKNHTEENYLKESAGELSQAELQEANKEYKQRHKGSGNPIASTHDNRAVAGLNPPGDTFVDTASWSAGPINYLFTIQEPESFIPLRGKAREVEEIQEDIETLFSYHFFKHHRCHPWFLH